MPIRHYKTEFGTDAAGENKPTSVIALEKTAVNNNIPHWKSAWKILKIVPPRSKKFSGC